MVSQGLAMFVVVLVVCFAVGGLVVLLVGARGRAVLSAPTCARCRYDVRGLLLASGEVGVCPECGADLKGEGAVSFGTYRRRPRVMWVGVGMVLLPFLLVPLLLVGRRAWVAPVPPGGAGRGAGLSNAQVIAGLATNVDAPWDWQELERRRAGGTLSKQEVDQAIVFLINDLKAKRASGRSQMPLHWAGDFVDRVMAGGEISDGRREELLRAYYWEGPEFECRGSVRVGESLMVNVLSRSTWNLGRNKVVYALGPVTADGGTVLPVSSMAERGTGGRGPTTHPDYFSSAGHWNNRFAVSHGLEPGMHEVEFAYDMGVVTAGVTMKGLDGKPGTPEKWPKPLARWRATTRRSIMVVPAGEALVRLVNDERADPFRTFTLAVEQAAVRPASDGVELLIRWKTDGRTAVPVSYRVSVRAGEETVDCGLVVAGVPGYGTGDKNSGRLKSLGADVRTVEITLTPDAKGAEIFPTVTRIWGGTKVIKGVVVERFDVDGGR